MRLRQLLSHHRQQRVGAPAVALDDRGDLVALADLHAGAIDLDVGHQELPAAVGDMPGQLDRVAVLALDLAGDDRLLAILAAARVPGPPRDNEVCLAWVGGLAQLVSSSLCES